MSKFFTLCKANSRKHGLNDRPMDFEKKTKRSNINFSLYFSVVLIFCILFSAGYFLLGITKSATAGFEISNKQEKLEKLKLQNEDLKEMASNLENLDSLSQKADTLGMVKVSNVQYLDLSESGVAMR